MIITILSVILFLIFSVLGGLHLYWLFGGLWGLEKVIPTKSHSTNTASIPKLGTLIVALVLALFGLIYLLKSGLITLHGLNRLTRYAYWFIPSIFALRAIGDF